MSCPLEIKYLSVTWSENKSLRSITESRSTLSINEVSSTEYEVDAITYSKINDTRKHGQIAFRIIDPVDGNSSPEIISGENRKPLFKIIDEDTKKVWWIEDGAWKKITDQAGETFVYKDSPICRHAGKVEVVYEGVQCFIKIRSSSFTYKELDRYLADFKSGLWELILDDKSYVTAERNKSSIKIANEELLSLLNQFIKYSENILQTPKKELRESQSLQRADKVRPSSRTFKDIALKSMSAKELTGRDYIETYDMSENQYVHGLILKIYNLIAGILDSHRKQDGYIDSENKRAKKRLDSFVDTIKIDKELTLKEERGILDKINKEPDNLRKALGEQAQVEGHLSYQTSFIKIISKNQKSDANGRDQFWAMPKPSEQDEWNDNFGYGKQCSLNLIFDPEFSKVLTVKGSYRITAYTEERSWKKSESNNVVFNKDFMHIKSAEIIESAHKSALVKLQREIERLEKLNWTRPLSSEERKEQDYEKKLLRQKLQWLSDIENKNKESGLSFFPIMNRLRKQKKECKDRKIKVKYDFPGSMTFIQNKNYQGVHKLYKKVLDSAGVDEEELAFLEEFESIPILDIPTIYERWCLLQIIKVLIDKLQFTPENGWKKKLLQQLLQTGKNIKLVFENTNINRKITLHYELELKNRKRPDFVIDVESPIGSGYSKRFVMDAKFYEEIKISEVVDQLYNDKNYSEGSCNMVFVLHPSSSAIVNHTTPSPWGNHSYYGEAAMFNWTEDNVRPDHKYGSIFLSPIDDAGSNDNLQRLLGMFLQYGLEKRNHDLPFDEDYKIIPFPEKELFCVVCGSEKKDVRREDTKKGYRYEITCKDCSHLTRCTYCWNCKNRLIKNGIYWTYHATHPLSPYDIRCPYCSKSMQDFLN